MQCSVSKWNQPKNHFELKDTLPTHIITPHEGKKNQKKTTLEMFWIVKRCVHNISRIKTKRRIVSTVFDILPAFRSKGVTRNESLRRQKVPARGLGWLRWVAAPRRPQAATTEEGRTPVRLNGFNSSMFTLCKSFTGARLAFTREPHPSSCRWLWPAAVLGIYKKKKYMWRVVLNLMRLQM